MGIRRDAALERRNKMKVKFKNLLMGYTGKADDSVIYYSPKLGQYIIRRAPKSRLNSGNRTFAEAQKRIFALNPSLAFREDIKRYLRLYNSLPANRDKAILSWNYLYSKMMWNMHHIYKVDLTSISREDLASLPCRTIATAVEAGLLPKVKGYLELEAEI